MASTVTIVLDSTSTVPVTSLQVRELARDCQLRLNSLTYTSTPPTPPAPNEFAPFTITTATKV